MKDQGTVPSAPDLRREQTLYPQSHEGWQLAGMTACARELRSVTRQWRVSAIARVIQFRATVSRDIARKVKSLNDWCRSLIQSHPRSSWAVIIVHAAGVWMQKHIQCSADCWGGCPSEHLLAESFRHPEGTRRRGERSVGLRSQERDIHCLPVHRGWVVQRTEVQVVGLSCIKTKGTFDSKW